MSKTREERRRRRDILTGIAWLLLCAVVFCGAHYVAEAIPSTPMRGHVEGVGYEAQPG